jgi:ADP-heptose:LPS heptosyltransferase
LKAAVRHRYDGFIELKDHVSSTSLIIARLFRSRVKTGCNRSYFRPYHRDAQSVIVPGSHILETTRQIGQLAGLLAGDYKPSLVLSPNAVEWFRRNYAWDRPFIFLNLSATHPDRLWPVEHWARYVRGCGLADQSILINGVPKHQEMVHQLCGELPGAVTFQPRHFLDVAAALADARLVLTVDTGVVHACSALDKPIVAFYCNDESVTRYVPLSTRHLMIQPQHGHIVSDIDPEQAIAETRRCGLT